MSRPQKYMHLLPRTRGRVFMSLAKEKEWYQTDLFLVYDWISFVSQFTFFQTRISFCSGEISPLTISTTENYYRVTSFALPSQCKLPKQLWNMSQKLFTAASGCAPKKEMWDQRLLMFSWVSISIRLLQTNFHTWCQLAEKRTPEQNTGQCFRKKQPHKTLFAVLRGDIWTCRKLLILSFLCRTETHRKLAGIWRSVSFARSNSDLLWRKVVHQWWSVCTRSLGVWYKASCCKRPLCAKNKTHSCTCRQFFRQLHSWARCSYISLSACMLFCRACFVVVVFVLQFWRLYFLFRIVGDKIVTGSDKRKERKLAYFAELAAGLGLAEAAVPSGLRFRRGASPVNAFVVRAGIWLMIAHF